MGLVVQSIICSNTVAAIAFLLLQLLPFTAACPASHPQQTLTRVVLGEDHLFAALWEGHGGSQAARHCVTKCYETLLDCMKAHQDATMAFKQALKQLDQTYFSSDLPDIVSTISLDCGACCH